jgi:hypothetical protein
MISTKNNIIPQLMLDVQISWWLQKNELPAYFWFHYLFEALCTSLIEFEKTWSERLYLPSLSANIFSKQFNEKFDRNLLNEILNYTYVQKLTYKVDIKKSGSGTTFYDYLIGKINK